MEARTPRRSDPPPTDALDDFLCFAVYSANLAFGRAYQPILKGLGLSSYTQFIVIVALSEKDDETVRALGERLFLESNTLTPILKKLEALGHIERRRDPVDERQVRIKLTASGRRLRERARRVNLKEAAGLGADLPGVRRRLTKLRSNLLSAAEDRPAP